MAETVRIEIPIEVTDGTEPELSNITDNLEDMERAAKNAKSSVERASKEVSKFDKSSNKMQKSLSSWAKQKYQLFLEAKDKASPILDKLKTGLKTIGGKTWNVTMKAIDLATSPIRGIINLLKNPVFQVGAVLGVSISLKDTVDTYTDFEATMSRVKALANANNQEMEALTAKAKEMGAQTKFSGTESAEAFTYMAQAGWQVQDMIDGIGGIMSLAAADGLDLASTTDIVSNALTAFGMTAKDTAEFADVLAVASSATNTDVSDLGEAFKYIAPVAGAMGYSIQDASVALGLMSNNAVKGSMAGTALKTALANMAAPTDAMAAAMQKYGISLTDSEGNMKTLKGVMDNLRSSLGGLSETEQTAAASTIFGKEAMAGMLAIINTSEADYRKLTEAINDSQGAADRMAGTMQDNLKGSLEQLGGAIETVQLSWGERLKPYIIALSDMLQENMPAIEEFGLKVFDAIDKKIAEAKAKIDEFTNTDEWADADIFGKVGIAWDELVGQPFSEWWESTGKVKIAGVANDIGHGIGAGISTGIAALMGIDVDTTFDEGASIGKEFASGFTDGIKGADITGAFGKIVSGVFSNAAKFIPGGESPDLSSLFSLAAIAKVGGPLLSMGSGMANVGKGVYKSATGGTLKNIIGSFSIADELAGVGNASGSGLLGLAGKAGMALGSGATTSTGLALAGAGGIAGGVVGGAALVSGGLDAYSAYKSYKAGDTEAAKAQGTSAGLKVGGVGAGAAAGAAIGSIFGGIGAVPGALIGAGVGGLAGWLGGNKVKKDYEESAAAADLLAEKSEYALQGAKFDSQKLKEAFNDTNVSAEQFASMMEEAVGTNIRDHFGDIKLSMQEIQDIAKQMTFGENIEAVTKFADASEQTKQAYSNMESAISNMDKLNWKASLGLEFDDTDIQEYVNGIDTLIQGAADYIESKHYEAKTAIDLLIEPDSDVDMTSGLNAAYAGLQEQIDSLGTQLTAKVNVALEDGVITLDEQAEITNLQNQITEITQKVADIQTEAEFKALKIKYSGAALDADSFAELQAELQEQVESATQSYDEALKVGIASLELQLDEGAISQEQYDEQLQALADGYDAKISDMSVTVENFQLEAIAEAYSEELDGILPELSGTTAEKLQQALHDAMASGVDVTAWDTETASQWLGLDSLSAETQAAISEMMSSVAETIPQSIQEQITSAFSNVDMSSAYSGIDFVGPISNEYYEQMSAIDLSSAYAPLIENISTGLPSQLASIDYSGIGTAVGSGVGSSIQNTDMGPINSAIASLKGNTGTAINTAFAPGFSTTTPVTITANYRLANPTATISFSGGGSGTATVSASIASNAEGDIIDSPILSWVGEDGPEAIIPLGGKRRSRGLSLWEKAGELLGVRKYAEGGLVGNRKYSSNPVHNDVGLKYISETITNAPWGDNEFTEDNTEYQPISDGIPVKVDQEDGGRKTEVAVNVTLNPTFQINSSGGNEADIVRIFRSHMKELADEIGGELADRLEMVFSNMPVRGEA